MRAVVELAMDREAPEMMAAFVTPLDAVLRSRGAGRIHRYEGERPGLVFVVCLKLAGPESLDVVLQFLAEANAPTGTIVYRLDWLGRKADIVMLGPGPQDDEGV